jgi:hypothetical protein
VKVPYSLWLLLSVGEWLNLANAEAGVARMKLAKLAGTALKGWKREVDYDAWRAGLFAGGAR